MASRMTAQVLESHGLRPGMSVGAALAVSALILILFGFLTAFRKAVRLVPQEERDDGKVSRGRKGRLFRRCLEDPSQFQRWIAISQVLAGASFLYWTGVRTIPGVVRQMGAVGLSAAGWLSVLFSVLFLFVLLLFGLVLPERASGGKEGRFALRSWFFLSPLIVLAGAVDFLLFSLGSAMLKLLHLPDIEIPVPVPTEEEFLQMLEAGHATGVIEDDNRELIANLFEFDDKIAGEVMTHRTEIEALPAEAGIEETMTFLADTKYTRFPVYEGSVDNIIGVLHVKDLLFYREQAGEEDFKLAEIMRPAWFTPETRNISDLLREMQQNHIQMTIVIDEYGGTAGLLTIEDLVEQIVGSIEDEYDEAEQEMIEIAPGSWLVEGTCPVDRLARVTGVPIDDDEYDTVAGLVIDLLDRIPESHERPVVEYRSLTFHVLAISDNRIVRIRVARMIRQAGDTHDQ